MSFDIHTIPLSGCSFCMSRSAFLVKTFSTAMPHSLSKLRDRVRDANIKSSFFTPSPNNAWNTNPFAAAYQPAPQAPRPPKRPGPPKKHSVVVSTTEKAPVELECTVCMETKENFEFPQRKVTSGCNHDVDVCTACLVESIDIQFTGKMWDRIACPSCGVRLEPEDVNKFGSFETKNKSVPSPTREKAKAF